MEGMAVGDEHEFEGRDQRGYHVLHTIISRTRHGTGRNFTGRRRGDVLVVTRLADD